MTARSAPFILAVAPPTGTVLLSEELFSPLESSPTITLSISASAALAKMDSWSMRIIDPAGNLFRSFDGAWPDDSVIWDGIGNQGYRVESAEDYAVKVYWDDVARGAVEQEQVLVPLSIARAEAIARAKITTRGVGAADQPVPDSNLLERWRNRRVAIFLERP